MGATWRAFKPHLASNTYLKNVFLNWADPVRIFSTVIKLPWQNIQFIKFVFRSYRMDINPRAGCFQDTFAVFPDTVLLGHCLLCDIGDVTDMQKTVMILLVVQVKQRLGWIRV